MKELEYPFNAEYIQKKRKSIRRELLSDGTSRIKKKIAILGGSTTHDVMQMLELFLLNQGIEPEFYESEYAMWWEDVMFDAPELTEFHPDIIYIHTSTRNVRSWPTVRDDADTINEMLEGEYQHFVQVWKKITDVYKCPIIQNNFEEPFYRLLGNLDFSDIHGRVNYVSRLNEKFAAYAREHQAFYINDIHYMASCYGLQKWADPFYWHMYKYACAVQAIPELAYNLANIIKAIYGKNKKAYVLDMDNTLWGGVVGDDGPDNIEIGQETSLGQVYSEFQGYLKAHKDLGVLLTVDSKNDEENALAGLARPDSVLNKDDFVCIKANWENKDRNIVEIANELNIGTDSLVFVDDNPAERAIVAGQVPGVAVPDMPEDAAKYLVTLDRAGFFEPIGLSEEDLKKSEMYKANAARRQQEAAFSDYGEYLKSLEMKGEIAAFAPQYMSRIAQLTNKSNQFNLTTRRCSLTDIENVAADPAYITLYGRLEDKFGDNGVVSVVYGHRGTDEAQPATGDAATGSYVSSDGAAGNDGSMKRVQIDGTALHIDLWLMSCRVLKRGMEDAMLDALVTRCKDTGITKIYGYYYPTAKNGMVKDFFDRMGFTLGSEDGDGNKTYSYEIPDSYENRNKAIDVDS